MHVYVYMVMEYTMLHVFDRYHGIGLLVQGQFNEPKVDNSK